MYLFPEKPGAPRKDPDTMLDEEIERLRPDDLLGHAFSGHPQAQVHCNCGASFRTFKT